MSAARRGRETPERAGFPAVGPWDRTASICPATLVLRSTVAVAECWLHDHRFPDS